MTLDELKQLRRKALVIEAKKWVGIHEIGSNSGQIIQLFQTAIDSTIDHAWCLSFIQYCLKNVDLLFNGLFPNMPINHNVFKSENVCACFNNTENRFKSTIAYPGSIIFWQHTGTAIAPVSKGHCGIITDVYSDNMVKTIEGNTSDNKLIARDGDGVFIKDRSIFGSDKFRLLGIINPWG